MGSPPLRKALSAATNSASVVEWLTAPCRLDSAESGKQAPWARQHKKAPDVDRCVWCFDESLLWDSFDYVSERAPNVDAYLINGMSNYRRPSDGLAQRPVHHTEALESRLGRPVIGHDTALYWRVFKTLGITPEIAHGQLLSSLGGNS